MPTRKPKPKLKLQKVKYLAGIDSEGYSIWGTKEMMLPENPPKGNRHVELVIDGDDVLIDYGDEDQQIVRPKQQERPPGKSIHPPALITDDGDQRLTSPDAEIIDKRRRRLYINALCEGETSASACRMSGLSRYAITRMRALDSNFADEEMLAYAFGTETLESAALHRGRDGTEEPVVQGGRRVYEYDVEHDDDGVPRFVLRLDEHGQPIPVVKKTYADNLLQFVLAARDPRRYGRQRMELTGADGGPVETRVQLEFVKPVLDGKAERVDDDR